MRTIYGPACPKCGCPDTLVLKPGQPDSWIATGQAKCEHCGHDFSFPQAAGESAPTAVIYHPIRCPNCHSKNTHVHTTRVPVRYHTCDACGYKFKSVENP